MSCNDIANVNCYFSRRQYIAYRVKRRIFRLIVIGQTDLYLKTSTWNRLLLNDISFDYL